ncbi:MAG: hypothetical protein ACE5GD_08925 [Candidatus Geothermarchaeales archaeon]
MANVEVRYTSHLRAKMVIRGVPEELPEMVFRGAERRFRDEATGHFVALKKTSYAGKRRLIMVVYDVKDGVVEIVTVHPISSRQVESRIKSLRWVHV